MENLVSSMPKKGLLSVDQAISAIVKKILPLKKEEKIKLSDSLGRILSKNVISKRNNPSEDTSAMDGFAIHSKSITNEFKIIGESSAGNPFKGKVGKNETVQIFTGSFLPKGTDTVIIQENTKNLIEITSEACSVGRTGVEMEALTAVSAAALTIYDMCKSLDKEIIISDIKLKHKSGGKSGIFNA